MRKISTNHCILIGMVNSPHFQTWVEATLSTQVFKKIIIFPSDCPRNPGKFVRLCRGVPGAKISLFRLTPHKKVNFYLYHLLDYVFGITWRSVALSFVLIMYKPRIVHYHEMQHGGYILLPIKKQLEKSKSVIVGSTWGSDLKFFAYTSDHFGRIQNLLQMTDILTAERLDEREELSLFNYSGEFIAPVYISIGSRKKETRNPVKSSDRKTILIRGYQHDQGRALNALKALETVGDKLNVYNVKVFSSEKSPSVRSQAQIMKRKMNIKIELLPRMSHLEFLRQFEESRIYIGLSETDGLSTSMVEAMEFGAFPIQSKNSAANIFIENGENGFIVDPWDIPAITNAIKTALRENELVNTAAVINSERIRKLYNWNAGVEILRNLYLRSQK
jgi:glycosyltransferase involved in cell wall biosynthesis